MSRRRVGETETGRESVLGAADEWVFRPCHRETRSGCWSVLTFQQLLHERCLVTSFVRSLPSVFWSSNICYSRLLQVHTGIMVRLMNVRSGSVLQWLRTWLDNADRYVGFHRSDAVGAEHDTIITRYSCCSQAEVRVKRSESALLNARQMSIGSQPSGRQVVLVLSTPSHLALKMILHYLHHRC